MFDQQTRLSLDEFLAFTPLLPSRSKSSLACSNDVMIASKTLSPASVESNSKPKETVDPSTVRLVYPEVPHDAICLGKASAPTLSSSSLVPPQAASVQASVSVISHSVDNLGCSEPTELPCLSMLHLHPFSQASAHRVDSGSSSYWVKPSGCGTSSSALPEPPGPPLSASFMDMEKDTPEKRRSHIHEVQGRLWEQSVSDGIPLIARKGGRRFWRTLIRPSIRSFLDNSKRQDTSSTSFASTKLVGSDAFLSSFEELPPRPAPYFYPRRVESQKDEISYESTHESFFCNLGELPAEIVTHEGGQLSKIQKKLKVPDGSGGVEKSASVDSDEIETWRKRQADFAAQKSRPSLRQRFGSSLRQSIGLQQLRSAFSELDLSQLARQQDESEALGPGITNDPFASLSTSPQLLPTQVIFPPATSSSSLTPTASLAPATSLPLLCSSDFVLDFTNPNLDTKRRSFINMDPTDCDDPSMNFSVSRSDNLCKQPAPSGPYANLGCLSVLKHYMQQDMPASIPQPQVGHESEDSGIQCQTPVLTPDLDSIEDSSPLLSDGFCISADMTSLKDEHDFNRTDIIPFPSLHSSLQRPPMPDIYEESAVEEGSSQDQVFHSCALGRSPRSVSLNSVGSNSIRSRRKFSLRGVGDEYLGDVSVVSVDMAESMADFTLLAVEWPQPPVQMSSEAVPTSEGKEDLECFILVDPVVVNSLHIQEGEHLPRSPAPDMSSLDEGQTATSTKPCSFVRRKTSTTRLNPVKLSSSVDFVEVTLGSSTLHHATLPDVIVLTPITKSQSTGTSISFRAASRPVLISFLALHAETRLEALSVSREGASNLAYVTLYSATDHNQLNPDTTTITLMNNGKGSPLMSAAENGSIKFTLGIPITLGELAVTIAKVSFGKGMVSDDK